MGSCSRDSPSSLRRQRYVSWCVDPAETGSSGEIPLQNHLMAFSGSVPRLLLTPADTREASPHQHTHLTVTKRTHKEVFTLSRHSLVDADLLDIDRSSYSHSDDEGMKGHEDDSSPRHPEDQSFLLLLRRSSPVISRRQRPVSWQGGGTDSFNPSRPDSLDQRQPASVTTLDDLDLHSSSRCVSVSSNLSDEPRLRFSGQQGLAEEHRGRGLLRCQPPHSSAHVSRQRRSRGVPEFSADLLKTHTELEKENAHFIVVDMVLEVLEGAKWTLMMDTHQNTQQHTLCPACTQQHTHCQTCTQQHTSSSEDETPLEQTQSSHHRNTVREILAHTHSDKNMQTSHRNTHSSYAHTHKHTQEEEEGVAYEEAKHQPKTFSILSNDSGFEDCGADSLTTQRDSLRNAEALAQQLVLEFRRSWLPSDGPRRGRQSLRSSLLELPGGACVTVVSSGLAEEIRLRTRMRGCLSWAPPRVQIIYTVQPNHRRSDVVAQQNFLCAGCGTELEHKYIKKLRYCEYLGRYFCDCCHSGSEAVIPARVLTHWDFSRFPVSDFSKQLLDSVWFQPLFDLSCVGKKLYGRVKELRRFRELQDQLLCIKKLLKACRLSKRVMTEFEQLPAHLTEQPHLFSMDDLLRVKKGQLVSQAQAVLNSAIGHVENCQLCLARGFICEFCREKDVIFPFQTDMCRRCPVCRACFHKRCFVEKKCPKCARIQSRKKRMDR
ncbi:protein associated with UVRAG as autophagy enhancer isoform X2 [Labrus mixtus]|uniref:protein associated with UVRAG as autophagy enhancer isoform X2 n=1 Tax=Labrus mixtus TaxID=508554 RepID=UPI0029C0CA8D|nr:protein associated with UVRAG as autophagy enhancer isoform X2 [Labrus mixtus]